MRTDVFSARRSTPADHCEHCGDLVDRVWLVPGDVLNSCRACYSLVMGTVPVHEQGHTSAGPVARPVRGLAAPFHSRADHRRPA